MADANANRRRNLNDDLGVGIAEILPKFRSIIPDHDGARRAYRRALTATDTFRIGDRLVKSSADAHFGTAVGKIDGADILHFFAHPDTVAA